MSRICFLVALSLMAWADPDLPQIPPDPKIDNAFARSNPGYRTRAGQFYEKDYLPQALAALQRRACLTPAQLPRARATLRAFLYHWLDAYVVAGGQQSDSGVVWLDRQFASWLEATQLEGYRRWKSDPENTLGFLFRRR